MESELRLKNPPLGRAAFDFLSGRVSRILLAVLCLGIVAWRGLQYLSGLGDDSWAPMALAMDYLHSGATTGLFETVFFDWGIKFQYPPTSLLFLQPVHEAGLGQSGFLNGINFILLLGNATLCAALAHLLFRDRISKAQCQVLWLAVFLIALLYRPIGIAYEYGQIQIGLDLLFSLTCIMIYRGFQGSAGFTLALATAVKPQFGPLLLVMMQMRRWRFVTAFVATGATLLLLSLVIYGLHDHLAYISVLRFLSERGESYYLNASVNGIANRFLNNGSAFDLVVNRGILLSAIPPYHSTVALLTKIATAVFLLIPFLVHNRGKDQLSECLCYGNAAVCFVLASPVAWSHHYGILLPVYLIALRAFLEKPDRRAQMKWIAPLLLSFALTGGRLPRFSEATGWATLLQAPVFFGACLLVALLSVELLERRRLARAAGADA